LKSALWLLMEFKIDVWRSHASVRDYQRARRDAREGQREGERARDVRERDRERESAMTPH